MQFSVAGLNLDEKLIFSKKLSNLVAYGHQNIKYNLRLPTKWHTYHLIFTIFIVFVKIQLCNFACEKVQVKPTKM